jgi:hypothetical protein
MKSEAVRITVMTGLHAASMWAFPRVCASSRDGCHSMPDGSDEAMIDTFRGRNPAMNRHSPRQQFMVQGSSERLLRRHPIQTSAAARPGS